MNLKDKHYDAFISYRHTDLDQFVAEQLHKKLEGFRLPGNMMKKGSTNQKNKITRVFRDRDELPLASDLADPITNALENSDFLIVICTPRLKESLWCKKEIQTFIAMHGREHVLAVLAEGEPADSFPEELLYVDIEEVNEQGETVYIRKPVEPLAADVRGTTKKQIMKKMRGEILRLLAPIFSCGYDDLKQRHRERRLKKIATFSLAGGSFFLLVGIVSTTMALRIQAQKVEIVKQSDKIEKQSDEIQVQYTEALKQSAIMVADKAEQLLGEGNRLEAINRLLMVMPENMETQDYPFTPVTQKVLTEGLHVYESGDSILPVHQLNTSSQVSFAKLSPDRTKALMVDVNDEITVWDVVNHKLLTTIPFLGDQMFLEDKQICFLDNETIYYPGETSFVSYDINANTVNYETSTAADYCCASEDGTKILLMDFFEGISMVDGTTGALLWEVPNEENYEFSSTMIFSKDNSLVAVMEKATLENETGGKVAVFDVATGEKLHQYSIPYRDGVDLYFQNGKLFTSVNKIDLDNENPFTYSGECTIYQFNLETFSDVSWKVTMNDCSIYSLNRSKNPENGKLIFQTYDMVGVLDENTGELIASSTMDSQIIRINTLLDSDYLQVFTRDGQMHVVQPEMQIDIIYDGRFQCTSDNLKDLLVGDGYVISLGYKSEYVVAYEFVQGSKMEMVTECNNYLRDVCLNKDETKELLVCGGEETGTYDLKLYDIKNNAVIAEQNIAMDYVDCYYSEKSQSFVLVGMYEWFQFDENDLAQKNQIEKEQMIDRIVGVNQDGSEVAIYSSGKLMVCNSETGEVTHEVSGEVFGSNDFLCNCSSDLEKVVVCDKDADSLSVISMNSLTNSEYVPEKTITLDTKNVTNVIFDDASKYICVIYNNNLVQVYELDTLDMVRDFSEIQCQITEVKQSPDSSSIVLLGETESYLLNQDLNIIEVIPRLKSVSFNNNLLFIKGDYDLKKVPIYSYDMLMQEAKEQVK